MPPFGSSDPLSYAAYGRVLVTGHNPYVIAPMVLAREGDPVARAVQDWAGTPSVYGALATGIQGLASLAGGTSARLTVFLLDLVNFAAFAGTGLLLDRLARRGARPAPGSASRPGAVPPGATARQCAAQASAAARLRAALLWTCNPVLLQVLVAGGHLDSQAVFFAVLAFALLTSTPRAARTSLASRTSPGTQALPPAPGRPWAFLAGAAVGLGFAVKPTVLLAGAGIWVTLRPGTRSPGTRSPGTRGAFTAGLAVVAGADIAVVGRAGIRQALRASSLVSVASPWRLIRAVMDLSFGGGSWRARSAWVLPCPLDLARVAATAVTRGPGATAVGRVRAGAGLAHGLALRPALVRRARLGAAGHAPGVAG